MFKGEVPEEDNKKSDNITQSKNAELGTIHLRRRHVLGGEGSKICQICRRIIVKNCRREGGRGQKL